MTPLRRLLPTLCLFSLLWAAGPALAAPGDAFEHLYFSGDELVESATRSPKPLSQVAENVTVVTAAEIRDMNAHTLAEVLNRVTGVFVQFFGVHPGATGLPHIQGSGETNPFRRGSEERHVTVLVDGMPWSSQTAGALLDTIPVGIIDRIEVVKGPASSAWGSSLGGVVNVLTKQPGRTRVPSGAVQGSYGERSAYDVRGEAAGAAGPLGYYLQGQAQGFDWDDAGADFRSRSAFAKTSARLAPAAVLTLNGGYANPKLDIGHLAGDFAFAQDESRAAYGRAALDLSPGGPVSVHLSAYRLHQDLDQSAQEDGTFAPAGDLLRDVRLEERTTGTQARGVWAGRGHTAVVGADWARISLDQRIDSGDFFQSLGAPPAFEVSPTIRRWGVYANDTVLLGPVAVIPGLRYDDSDLIDPFWSPSLGATWQASPHTLLRATVARGFAIPPLTYLEGGGISLTPNPDIEPERIWSYQLGAETTALGPLWLKLALFRHEVSDALVNVPSPDTGDSIYVNQGTIWRTGFEADAETASFHGLRLRGGFAYVRVERSGEDRDQDQHQAKFGLYYDRGTFHAQLFGHYVWWDLGPGAEEGRRNDALWDLNARKGFGEGLVRAEVFAAVHNLFNGDQSSLDVDRGTAGRWVEGGVRVLF